MIVNEAPASECIGCLDPVTAGEPTCGAAACLRIFRFAERTAGPDPDQDVWDYLDGTS